MDPDIDPEKLRRYRREQIEAHILRDNLHRLGVNDVVYGEADHRPRTTDEGGENG